MNFNRSGWLNKYIDFRSAKPFPLSLPSMGVRVVDDPGVHNDLEQAIYYFLQPTGLLYGSLLQSPFPSENYPRSRYFDSLSETYVVFLESLFACLVSDRQFLLDDLVEEEDRFRPVLGVAMSYFLKDVDALDKWPRKDAKRSWFSSNGRGELKRFERELGRRITRGSMFVRRPELFYNSFLFLDLYDCLIWQRRCLTESNVSNADIEELAMTQMARREKLIELMIGASHSDGFTQKPERRMIEHFIKSSGLPKANRAELSKSVQVIRPMEEIEIPEMPWIIRRYFLELLLMVVLVDHVFTDEEHLFIELMVQKLGLWEEEMEQSLSVLELFLIGNEDRLNYLKSRSNIASMHKRIQERAGVMLRRNMDGIVNEIKETQELYTLLMKAASEPLNQEEKIKVRNQLTDILKAVPALAIFALPGGGIVLPLLIRLLPFNLLPSSFED